MCRENPPKFQKIIMKTRMHHHFFVGIRRNFNYYFYTFFFFLAIKIIISLAVICEKFKCEEKINKIKHFKKRRKKLLKLTLKLYGKCLRSKKKKEIDEQSWMKFTFHSRRMNFRCRENCCEFFNHAEDIRSYSPFFFLLYD